MTEKQLSGYSRPKNLGHREIDDLFASTVLVQEKFDGSQISFGVRDGELFVRSRNQMVDLDNPGMFAKAVASIKAAFDVRILVEGYTYRGEYIQKPKHNTLEYDNVPVGNIILFDVDAGNQHYLHPIEVALAAASIGIEHASWYFEVTNVPVLKPQLDEWIAMPSQLGGIREGVVLKNYDRYTRDGKVMMGKYVSQEFREKHSKSWKKRNPNNASLIDSLGLMYGTEARWAKAVQHLEESGDLQGSMRDIPALMVEIRSDVLIECGEEIKEALFKKSWRSITKRLTQGMPSWYKQRLFDEQFPEDITEEEAIMIREIDEANGRN